MTDVNLLDTLQRAESVIVSFFSNLVYSKMHAFGQQTEIAVLTVVLFSLWLVGSSWVVKWMDELPSLSRKHNQGWKKVLTRMLDFFSMLFVFVLLQYLLSWFSDAWTCTGFDTFENVVAIIFTVIFLFAGAETLRKVSVDPIRTNQTDAREG